MNLDELREVTLWIQRQTLMPMTPDGECYIVPIHPSALADLVAMQARAKWKAEHRRRRLASKGIIDPGYVVITHPSGYADVPT